MTNPLIHKLEDEFHGASNQSVLKELHRNQDYNALLEYALLLAESEASQRSQIKWLIGETCNTRGIKQWHVDLANELLRGSRP